MNAYIFDVDGVLTDPQAKKITEPRNIEKITDLIKQGHTIALITGRAVSWVQERVLYAFQERLQDTTLLKNVYISCEFGNSLLTFENGLERKTTHANCIPKTLMSKVQNLSQKYKNSMAIDPLKETMISIEMYDGYDLCEFEKEMNRILPELEYILNQGGYNDLEITHDIIAINIKNKEADKAYAAKQFLEWLKTKDLKLQKYIAFGDSHADIEIAEELAGQNLPVEFIFVGANKKTVKQESFPVVTTASNFEAGTLEYLTAHL